jgi:hercynylcysteine S-oxide lyase
MLWWLGTGTLDPTLYLSVIPALDFREAIGGEKKIRDYCHFLALAGGRSMANIFGTSLLDQTDSGELIACMVV